MGRQFWNLAVDAAVIVALAVPTLSAAQKPISLQSRALTDKATGDEEPTLAEPKENLLFYTVPTSLEGPVDPETYALGPSDELSLIIRGPETTFHQLRVLPEGNLILPNVGLYPVTGMTLAELKRNVKEVLKRYYKNVEIDIVLTKPRSFVVYISGEVVKPGVVELTAPFRVGHAIAAAGGVTKQGSLRLIEVRENGTPIHTADLFMFLENGDVNQNPIVKEGQTIHVPPPFMKASSVGELRGTGTFEILPGETVADLIRFSGGFATTADTTHLIVERTNPGSELNTIVFPGDSAAYVALKDLDVLVVPDLVSLHGIEPVEVLGGGGRQGAFQIGQSETLGEFIFRLWRFTYGFDVETAVIERHVSEDETQYINFNVRDVLAGDSLGTTVLKPGDTVSFPVREKQVFVTGEVVAPGPIPFLPGNSAERYIALAGGPTSAGTYDRIEIFDGSGNIRTGNRNTLVYRGETIVVKQKISRTLGTWFWGATSLAGLALSIIAVSK
jgi:protein involved in polysaccharide export with SLBB domain